MPIKRVRVRPLTRYNLEASMKRQDRDLIQIQLLILRMERQLVIITAMIDRLRRRWGLQQRQRRPGRYWVRPWLSQAEREEEGQYTRLMPRLELDDPMGYQNFIRMLPELFQELEQRLDPEIQRERTWMRDGKHIPIRCPRRGGSLYHNYKGFHSIVPLALVDGDYKFLWVDLMAARSSSDAQIFKHSDLRHTIEDGTIGFQRVNHLLMMGQR